MSRPFNRLLWVLMLLLTVAVGGCGKSAGDATSDFLTDYGSGKFAEAEKLLSKNSANQFDQAAQAVGGHDQLIQLLEQARQAEGSGALAKVEIGIITVIDDKATVHYTVTDKQGKKSDDREMSLVKEDGKWKVDFDRFAPWMRVTAFRGTNNPNGRGNGGGRRNGAGTGTGRGGGAAAGGGDTTQSN